MKTDWGFTIFMIIIGVGLIIAMILPALGLGLF